jgi:hypothetical protein
MAASAAALLRVEIDTVLADWAYHLDHGELDALGELWVNFAANAPTPVDDVGVYLVADFDDVLPWCADERWRISERRIIPVFRDPARSPITA